MIVDILINFIIIIFVLFILTIILDCLFSIVVNLYYWFQTKLIKISNSKNSSIIMKFIVANYKFYKILCYLIIKCEPFYFQKTKSDYFKTSIFDRKNITICIASLLISIFKELIFKYNVEIQSFIFANVNSTNIQNLFNRIISFMTTNKWYILLLILTISIIYEFYKDKYINKIILKIQDKELEEILIFHKSILHDCEKLEVSLCKNIMNILNMHKNNGLFSCVKESLLNSYNFCYYDYSINEFKLKTDKNIYPYSLNIENSLSDFEKIDKLNIIQDKYNDLKNKNLFYNEYSLKFYTNGLKYFAFHKMLAKYTGNHLLSQDNLHKICFKNLDEEKIGILILNKSFDSAIECLNELHSFKTNLIISDTIDTIEFVIDLDKYIKCIRKFFKLQKKRNGLSSKVINEVIEKIKVFR